MRKLPASLPEAEIVAVLGHWMDLIGAAMTSEASRAIVRKNICDRLRAGTLDIAWVIEAADAGHQDADLALRDYAATFADRGQWDELPVQVQGWAVRALLRAPVTYPRGKNVIDVLTRNIGIAVMVDLAVQRWSLAPTRGRSTEKPSAAYFVALVLCKRGIKLKEQQVARIYRDHKTLAARLAAIDEAQRLLKILQKGDDFLRNVGIIGIRLKRPIGAPSSRWSIWTRTARLGIGRLGNGIHSGLITLPTLMTKSPRFKNPSVRS